MDPALVSEVIPGRLYLGGCDIRLKHQFFYDYEIKRVIVLGSKMELKYYQCEPVSEDIDYREFVLEDKYQGDILPLIKETVELIEDSIEKEEAVLIHCAAGVNRSATIVIAYLMRSQGLKLEKALEELRKVRPRINPNDNFLKQIGSFE